MKRRRALRAEKDRLIRQWEGSGLSQSEFCRQRGLSAGSLTRWRNQADRRATAAALDGGDPLTEVRFVEAQCDSGEPEPGPTSGDRCPALLAELTLPGGILLRLYANPAHRC
jgi:transposase-like protein